MRNLLALMLVPFAVGAQETVTAVWELPTRYADGTLIPTEGPERLVATVVEFGLCNPPSVFVAKLGEVTVPVPATSAEIPKDASGNFCARVKVRDALGEESEASNVLRLGEVYTAPPPPPPPPEPFPPEAEATVTRGGWDLYRGSSIAVRGLSSEAACAHRAVELGIARTYTCRTRTTIRVH